MRHMFDDYQLLLICSVVASVLWIWYGAGMCYDLFDQYLYVVYGVSFPVGAFLVKRFRLIEKIKY